MGEFECNGFTLSAVKVRLHFRLLRWAYHVDRTLFDPGLTWVNQLSLAFPLVIRFDIYLVI